MQPEPSMAVESQRVRVSLFRGVSALPVLLAQSRGYFTELELAVEITATKSSQELMSGLLAGRFDIVHAAPDNFIEWRDRTSAPITAWLGGGGGPVALVAGRDVRDLRDLRGRRIAVDAVASGFVSVLHEILRSGGVQDGDVELVPLGATTLRFTALMRGETDASMLTLPWLVLAAEAGLVQLGDQQSVLPGMPGSCGASLDPWLQANPTAADAYLRAICAASTWMRLPDSRAELTAFVEELFGVDDRHAGAVVDAVLEPAAGCPPTPLIDLRGFATLCDLRSRNGHPPLGTPDSYVSLDEYQRVLGFGLLDPLASTAAAGS